jgi:zinc protease
VPVKNISRVEQPAKTSVFLVDRPGSIQSIIFAGDVAPPKANPGEIAIETMNYVLGYSFTSRINLNLREDKHWSYGARTWILPARGQRPFIAYASVQTDKTGESTIEMDRELRAILGPRPVTDAELKTAQMHETLQLPGSWETDRAILNSIGQIVRFGLPDDYFTTYPDKIRALTVSDLAKAAEEVVHPDKLVWVIVGDRARIEPAIRQLGWGDIQFLDADGNPSGLQPGGS